MTRLHFSPEIGAVGYGLDLDFSNFSFTVVFAVAFSTEEYVTLLRSERWTFPLPAPQLISQRARGYSETTGIIGGIKDLTRAVQSEAIERAISDTITVCFTELLERGVPFILIRGPALPKTVGRLLSLRPSELQTVAWITDLRSEDSSGMGETSIAGLSLAGSPPRQQDDYLVRTFSFPDNSPSALVDYLDIGDRIEKLADLRQLLLRERKLVPDTPTRQLGFASSALLPKGRPNYYGKGFPEWLSQSSILPHYVEPQVAKSDNLFRWKATKN